MKRKIRNVFLICASILLCVSLVQCTLFFQAQRGNEERFLQNFYVAFSEFSDRICCFDIENMSIEQMNICYIEIAEAVDYFTKSRPLSVGFFKPGSLFAPEFDMLALMDLRQHISLFYGKLSDGIPLEASDIEWLQLLRQELIVLQNQLYTENHVLKSCFLSEHSFTSVFQDFFDKMA